MLQDSEVYNDDNFELGDWYHKDFPPLHPIETDLANLYKRMRRGVLAGFGTSGINSLEIKARLELESIPKRFWKFYTGGVDTMDHKFLQYKKEEKKGNQGADAYDEFDEE